MKINWKVRLKNPVFWVTIIPTGCTLVYQILSGLGITPKLAEDTITNILLSIVTALATLGVLVDPTTQGVEDSVLAMSYDEPKPH